jgi:hypothetical protein
VFLVFIDTVFSGLKVHGPAVLPIVGFAGRVVQYMTGIAMLEALDRNPVEFDGFQDFRGSTAILEFFGHLCRGNNDYSLSVLIQSASVKLEPRLRFLRGNHHRSA